MIERDNPYIEILDSGNVVRIEPIEIINYNSDSDWDKNWIKTQFTIKGASSQDNILDI